MRTRLGAVLLLSTALLVGCGGADGGGGVAADDEKTKALKYAKCMRDNGVDMPDPTFGEDGSIRNGAVAMGRDDDPAVFTEAAEACREFEAANRFDVNDPELLAERVEFARCMREHGVNVPDPEAGSGLALDTEGVDDKTLQDAMTACGKGGAAPAAPTAGGR